MKASLCICFLVFVSFTTKTLYAQHSKVIIDSDRTVSIEEIFEILKTQTDHTFIYSVDLFKGKPKVKLKKEITTVGKLLSTSVEKQGYKVEYNSDGTITILTQTTKVTVPVLQDKIKITGTVMDADKMPLPGATVIEENTNNGTVTDFDGNFSIDVTSKESVLVFSYVGMVTVKRKVGENTNLSIELAGDTEALDEVVIVGYGTQKKSETTGSITKVKGESISLAPVQSFEGALSGQATGVNLVASAGVLNQAPVFRIRGTNSLSLSAMPLFVVDGVPMFTSEDDSGIGYAMSNPLSSINPSDIESIDIAKDAAATSIYGSRAANGVVFITTKQGKKGKTSVSYNTWVGFTSASNLPKVLNAAEYKEIKNEGLRAAGNYRDASNPKPNYYDFNYDANGNQIDTRWYDYIYRTGVSHNHSLNISGASEKTKYYGSVGYTDQNGIFKGNFFDRKSVAFNIDNQTTEWLGVGAKINYINENNGSAMSTGAAGNATATMAMARIPLMYSPLASPYNNDGSFNQNSNGFVGIQDNQGHLEQSRFGFGNPVLSLLYNRSNNTVDQIRSSAYITIKPSSWLLFRSQFGIDNRQINYDTYQSPLTNEGRSNKGMAYRVTRNRDKWVWTNTLTVDKVFNEVHTFNFLLGEEEQRTTGYQYGLQRTGQTDPHYTDINGGWQNSYDYNTDGQESNNYLFSLFGRIQYNFAEKYFLTANIRQDEYSALGINNKKGQFWGFSGGWELTKEGFWSNSSLANLFGMFKLRASYGKVGNVGGLNDFGAINAYSGVLYGGAPGLSYSRTGNPDLEWETSTKMDFGIDFSLFQNRLSGEISYYNNDVDGLIVDVPLPPSVGIPNGTINRILQNVGTMYNRGIEFSLNGTPITNSEFNWKSSLNFSTNQNKVTSLTDGVDEILGYSNYTITLPGYSVGMLNAVRTDGIDPATGRRIFLDKDGRRVLYHHVTNSEFPYKWQYEDGTVAPAVDPSKDASPYKRTAPTVFGGFSNNFNYKGFDLGVMLTYQLGGYMYNATRATMRDQRFWNNTTDVLNRWQKPGDITDIAKVVAEDNVSMGNTMLIDDNVSSTDFLRLKSITLGYTFPKEIASKLNFSNLKAYVSAQNLALWTKYSGMDPEVTTNSNNPISQGIDRNQAPNARTITLGLNVNF